ncbi:sorbitol dehydrogenase [Erysipelotrichaceae bacterium AF15-26LB]|nr:putative chlorophyll synthesis pathway protein BchC [Erysipelotrichaceae bacterium 3_1_53]MCR0349585.1 zinc-binding dehydrogenase [[Clostridium] innocuum]RJV85976.1 sorbitol dehydrogenase [Erysipelotrichaceae bacterium AF15-26LB]RJV86203.1 sorbitol dehydrogenase [Erysipelotrichaceae bacterium AF19-24AC]
MEKAKAWVIEGKDKLAIQELDIPEAGDYEVLFKTEVCSLCTVDRRTYKGTRNYGYPFLGGHECSGTIIKTGRGVVGVKPGDKAIFTSGYCNQCELDRSGRGTQCNHKKEMPQRASLAGNILGGGLCEYLVIPAWQVIRIPDDADLRHAALTEPLACCIHSIRKARIKFADTIVIIGMGIMGYFHLKLAQMSGARIIVSETDEKKRRMALQEGAAYAFNPMQCDVNEELRKLTDGLGADAVINTIPFQEVWQQAIDMLAPYGRLIAYSSQNSKEPIGVDFGKVHSREIEFIGTLNPTIEDNQMAVKLISYRMIDMEKVIDREFSFAQGKEAFEYACKPGVYRVMINYGKEGNTYACNNE